MLKKTMTYTDFDGQERTEDFYFNLTQAEVLEMEMSTVGGIQKLVDKIVAEKDLGRMIEFFKEVIKKAYGEKSLDGKYFIKSEDSLNRFMQTQAFSDLFIELATVPNAAEAFVSGIVPKVN